MWSHIYVKCRMRKGQTYWDYQRVRSGVCHAKAVTENPLNRTKIILLKSSQHQHPRDSWWRRHLRGNGQSFKNRYKELSTNTNSIKTMDDLIKHLRNVSFNMRISGNLSNKKYNFNTYFCQGHSYQVKGWQVKSCRNGFQVNCIQAFDCQEFFFLLANGFRISVFRQITGNWLTLYTSTTYLTNSWTQQATK
mgnify:CR=1 FL=1